MAIAPGVMGKTGESQGKDEGRGEGRTVEEGEVGTSLDLVERAGVSVVQRACAGMCADTGVPPSAYWGV